MKLMKKEKQRTFFLWPKKVRELAELNQQISEDAKKADKSSKRRKQNSGKLGRNDSGKHSGKIRIGKRKRILS